MYRDSTQDLLDGPPDKQGELMRAKNALVASDILERAYLRLMQDDTPLSSLLEWYKYTTKVADLEPKQNAVAPGAGFQIRIILPEGTGDSLTINSVVTDEKTLANPLSAIDAPIGDGVLPPPDDEPSPLLEIEGAPPELKPFTVPDFNLSELFGG